MDIIHIWMECSCLVRDKIQKLNFEAIYHLVKNRLLSFTVCEQFVRQYVEENPEDLVYVLE